MVSKEQKKVAVMFKKLQLPTFFTYSHDSKLSGKEGFFMRVYVEISGCRGLLVFILAAFEDMGLDLLHARVSCSHHFLLEAFGLKDNKGPNQVDGRRVELAVLQAIKSWSQNIMQ